MKSNSSNPRKPSLNPHNPRNRELFDWLVSNLEASGAPVSLPASDDLLALDLASELGFLPRSSRMVWLKAAMRAVLQTFLADCVDQIRDAAQDGMTETLLGGFVQDDFPGRDNTSTPSDHATLNLNFYGKPLPESIVRKWTMLAFAAAQAPAAVGDVVYFISLDSRSRVKIGFSSNLKHRLRALRTASSVEPTVHLTIPGTRTLENELRERFRADRIVREWFHLSPAILAFIAERKAGDP